MSLGQAESIDVSQEEHRLFFLIKILIAHRKVTSKYNSQLLCKHFSPRLKPSILLLVHLPHCCFILSDLNQLHINLRSVNLQCDHEGSN